MALTNNLHSGETSRYSKGPEVIEVKVTTRDRVIDRVNCYCSTRNMCLHTCIVPAFHLAETRNI